MKSTVYSVVTFVQSIHCAAHIVSCCCGSDRNLWSRCSDDEYL